MPELVAVCAKLLVISRKQLLDPIFYIWNLELQYQPINTSTSIQGNTSTSRGLKYNGMHRNRNLKKKCG